MLELRQSWLFSGILFNSEVWYGMRDIDIASFVIIDQYLIKGLMNAYSENQIEQLYLETGYLPIKYIDISRKFIYLKKLYITLNMN